MRVELTNVTRRYLIPASRIGSMPASPFELLPAIPSRGWLLKYVLFNHADDSTPHVVTPGDAAIHIDIRHDDSFQNLITPVRLDEVLAADASTHVSMPLPYEVQSNTAIELTTTDPIDATAEPLEVIIVADKLML